MQCAVTPSTVDEVETHVQVSMQAKGACLLLAFCLSWLAVRVC